MLACVQALCAVFYMTSHAARRALQAHRWQELDVAPRAQVLAQERESLTAILAELKPFEMHAATLSPAPMQLPKKAAEQVCLPPCVTQGAGDRPGGTSPPKNPFARFAQQELPYPLRGVGLWWLPPASRLACFPTPAACLLQQRWHFQLTRG